MFTLEAHELKLKTARLTLEYLLRQVLEVRPILGNDQWQYTMTNDLFTGVCIDHGQAGGVHFQQHPVLRQQLDALGLRIENSSEVVLALTQRLFRPTSLGD